MLSMYKLLIVLLMLPLSSVLLAKNKASVEFGSGWIVSPEYVVTNYHVVKDHEQAVIVLSDHRELNTRVAVRDIVNDLALLKVESGATLPAALPFAQSYPSIGEQVFTIGYPHPDVMGSNPKLSVGIINAKSGLANDPRLLQISTPLQTGNSGGPLLNMNGEVIGVVTSKLNAMKMYKWTGDIPQNVNYALKIDYLRVLLEITEESKHRPYKMLPSEANSLVNLAKQVQSAVVLVKAGAVVISSKVKVQKFKHEMAKAKPVVASKSLAVYIHMRRGAYDNLDTLDSTPVYSKNTFYLVKELFEKNQKQKYKVEYQLFGPKAERKFYGVYKQSSGIKLCKKTNTDLILAVMNDFTIVSNWHEDFSIVMRDCKTNIVFARMYTINPYYNDKFTYEKEIRESVNDFIKEIPESL